MTRPLLLDLFSGAGGAAMGYWRAGFDVVGVDHIPQPNYPFEFIEADAMTYPLDGFDVIHASPPCQDHSALASRNRTHGTGWMLEATIERLRASGRPWIVENVGNAQFPPDIWRVQLCGSSFGLRVRRHRWMATNVFLMVPPCDHGRQGTALGVYGHMGGGGNYGRGTKASTAEAPRAMGIDWMTPKELTQAIPPAYTHFLGEQLMRTL